MTGPVRVTFRMTQELIDGWADLSDDHNPLHVSPEHAAASRFGGTIAHGAYTVARMEALMESIAGAAWRSGGQLLDIRFLAPVRPERDYTLTATGGDGAWRLELRDDDGAIVIHADAGLGPAAVWAS